MNVIGLDEAYAMWADDLVRFATVLTGPDSAADVVADTFVALLNRPDHWEHADHPRPYLFGAVTNQARMHHRSSDRRRHRTTLAATRQPAATPPSPNPDLDSAIPLDTLIACLSDQQRAFVYLAYWEDWTASMIATHLDVSEGTVRKQLARARAALREELE